MRRRAEKISRASSTVGSTPTPRHAATRRRTNGRADDAPPYFTIFVTGHLLVPPVLIVLVDDLRKAWRPGQPV